MNILRMFGSFLAGIFWGIVGRIFGAGRQAATEKELAETKKENHELRVRNAGLRVQKQVAEEEQKVKDEWEDADTDEKYEILKCDFDTDD